MKMRKLNVLLLMLFTCCASGFGQKESLLIGPGDLLHIQVLEAPEEDQHARVTDAGDVPLILGGDVHVAGLAPSEAANAIAQKLMQGNFILHPHVSVVVEQYASETVSVIGQVRTPGNYPVPAPRSILDVIAYAGGLTEMADRKVTIQRGGSKERLTYYLSNNADAALDATIQIYPGDTVVVPKVPVVYVLGDVGHPGGYAMATDDSRLTVLQVIALAGSTPPTAVPSHTKLVRQQADGTYVEINVPLSDMQKGKRADLPLQANDILYVPFSYLRNIAMGATSLVAAATTASVYRF
jgi:polysaccharide export outer membrane protein